MYKVFVLGKPVILVQAGTDVSVPETQEIHEVYSQNEVQKVVHDHKANDAPLTVIVASNIDELWNWFRSGFQYIEAAGGAVFNEQNQLLCIFRNGKWDLPKGKRDEGERMEETAVREVEEECGISNIRLENHLTDTYHTYTQNGTDILKRTAWYSMSVSGTPVLVPQTEEGITKTEWRDLDNLDDVLANTYGSIKDVLVYLLPQ